MPIIPTIASIPLIIALLCLVEFFIAKMDWRFGVIMPAIAILSAFVFSLLLLVLAAALLIAFAPALLIHAKRKKKGGTDRMQLDGME
jgi:hypothetical protein